MKASPMWKNSTYLFCLKSWHKIGMTVSVEKDTPNTSIAVKERAISNRDVRISMVMTPNTIMDASKPAGTIMILFENRYNTRASRPIVCWFSHYSASNACVPTNTKNHPSRSAEQVYSSAC